MKEVADENSIFKLKCALKKLESPEKIKVNKKVKLIESINKKRKSSTKVADLVRCRESESKDCSRNSSVVFRINENYCKYRTSRPSSFFQLTRCENNFSNTQI